MRIRIMCRGGIALALLLSGCKCGPDELPTCDSGTPGEACCFDPPCDCAEDPTQPGCMPPPSHELARASRATPIDTTKDNRYVGMVNTDEGTFSVFRTADNSRRSRIPTGGEPSAIVFAPDISTAYVANQADATVVRVRGIDTDAPSIDATVDVGSEPTGLALSPTGALLFVAEWGEGRVSVINTGSMTIQQSFPVRAPYALAVTNNLDTSDNDELLVIPEFFGRPNANGEANNSGRDGVVQIRALSALTTSNEVILPAIDSTFNDGAGGANDFASANQLFGVNIVGDRAFVTTISVSPERPVRFNQNVHPIVRVINLTTRTEDTTAQGTMNLAGAVRDNIPMGETRFFLADTVNLDFIGNVAYFISRGADVLQRIDYGANPPGFGVTGTPQIDLNQASMPCQMPTGVVTTVLNVDPPPEERRAYVNCRVTRNLGIVDLRVQGLVATAPSGDAPSGAAANVNLGLRFFFTGRGRWSSEAWSGCSSCHPGGLTDNITWRFDSGPRQSVSLDGSFSHGAGTQEQRLFNWTGFFDEVHDFERNTRNVSGGKGAVTNGDCSSVAAETAITLGTQVGVPVQETIATSSGLCAPDDWDNIEAWMRTIRPPRGRTTLDAAAVTRGATVFTRACSACHGGAGWTVSRMFWEPTSANTTALITTDLPALSADASNPDLVRYMTHISTQPTGLDAVADAIAGGAGLAPPHVTCGIRDVGTFGVRTGTGTLDVAGTDALEQRKDFIMGTMTPLRALGGAGYNVPSLYGVALGAPYLHHGQAATLEELLDPAGPWQAHALAVDSFFGMTSGEVTDVIAFILSIDASTNEIAPASSAGADPAWDTCLCPSAGVTCL